MRTNNIAHSGAKTTGEGTPNDPLSEVPAEEIRELATKLRTLEASLAELQVNVALTELVAGLRHDIEALSASFENGNSELAQRENAMHELERRLKEAVRQMRTSEEYARQVMLELLRVRDQQEATQKYANATAVKAALAGQQTEEVRALLRKSESARLEMEQTPGWWLIKSFHDRMKRSATFAKTVGFMVKLARSLRLLPAGSTEEARRIAALVDQEYYFRAYPEARAWGVPAAEHYFRLGASKGYNPSPVFDTQFYLAQYPDVAAAGVNPLLHYVDAGAGEGRLTHAAPQEAPAAEPSESPGEPVAASAGSLSAAHSDVADSMPELESIKLPERFAVQPHQEPVSIIVTVHNALEYVRACLSSILQHTSPPFELVLVDDGSEPQTREYLRQFAAQHDAVLIRNQEARAYTLAANQGLRAARGEYALLLNSDTVVTENWLDRMVMCAESDPHIGMVGPLSNRANWQSIPEAVKDGEWADNELPENWTVQDTARAVAAFTGRTYPRIPFLNGFCLLIKRQVLEGVGYFDEMNFGRGYGEENDYCLRARAQGWVAAVADDAYVYHARTRSYSIEHRDELSEVAHRMLYTKHKRALVDKSGDQVRDDLVLLGIRARASQMFARQSLIEEGRRLWEGKRIAFVLPIGERCGVGDVVLTDAEAIQTFGARVVIVNLLDNTQTFRSAYPELDLRVAFVPSGAEVLDAVRGCDAVVATTSDSMFQIQDLASRPGAPGLAYYIQDYEPNFFPPGSTEHQAAWASYSLIPDMIRFTRTDETRDVLLRRTCVESSVVGISCDVDLFRPRVVPSTGKLNLSAIIRPSPDRRAALETVEILSQANRQFGDRVAIHIFGVDSRDPFFVDLPRDFQRTNHGLQTREQTAALLSAQDIFVDLSPYRTTNLTALEAMASGAAAVLPQTGGYAAFAAHGENALLVDASNRTACFDAIGALIEDSELLARLRRRAINDAVRLWPEQAAFKIMSALFLEKEPVPGIPSADVSSLTAQVRS